MKKIYWLFIFLNCYLINNISYADKLGTISINLANLVGIQKNILSIQSNIQGIMKQLDSNMTGHSGWGTYQFQDHQSYGKSANDWNSVLQMAENSKGEGQLGAILSRLAKDFPANQAIFNGAIRDNNLQKYYALKSQTALSVRSASELDYNKIQTQITYQQMLQGQIEKTEDLKAAVDLNNRINVENNLIQLEMLRQMALANQQQSITEQASINSALTHAKFLSKEEK